MTAVDTEFRPSGGLHARQFDRGAHVALENNPYIMVRPPLLHRVLRASARFLFAVLLGIGGTLAWQSHGDQAMDVIRAKAPSVAEWLPASTSRPAVPVSAAEAQQSISLPLDRQWSSWVPIKKKPPKASSNWNGTNRRSTRSFHLWHHLSRWSAPHNQNLYSSQAKVHSAPRLQQHNNPCDHRCRTLHRKSRYALRIYARRG